MIFCRHCIFYISQGNVGYFSTPYRSAEQSAVIMSVIFEFIKLDVFNNGAFADMSEHTAFIDGKARNRVTETVERAAETKICLPILYSIIVSQNCHHRRSPFYVYIVAKNIITVNRSIIINIGLRNFYNAEIFYATNNLSNQKNVHVERIIHAVFICCGDKCKIAYVGHFAEIYCKFAAV